MAGFDFDAIVVGGGVIGLATLRELSANGLSALLVEKNDRLGEETSSRNSEVMHAGIYYTPGSLKAELCVAGRDLLYAYCREYHVQHRQCGKLIVAQDEHQVAALSSLMLTARQNDVLDLELLSPGDVRSLEPNIDCVAAIWSPSTGIIDTHGLMTSLQALAEQGGAVIACQAEAVGATVIPEGWQVSIAGDERVNVTASLLINAAGLGAADFANSINGLSAEMIPTLRYAKGSYFGYAGKTPFRHLIYPVPEPGGLGVHLTLDLAGRARFGPDVEWVDRIDYSVDSARLVEFAERIRRYWPDVELERLYPDYAGVRPKLWDGTAMGADFRIVGPSEHGMAGLICLFGIESPGITASLAIARRVVQVLTANAKLPSKRNQTFDA